MNTILWEPSKDQINSSQLEAFRLKVNNRFNLNIKNYSELHSWSISNISDFWKAIWGYMAIEFSSDYIQVVDDKTKMPGAKWFEGARFNFAENLLRVRSHKPGIHFKGEGQPVRTVTYNELFAAVEKLASALRKMGVQKGDRVAGFMPNMPETIIAMLATTSIGAIWSSSSPDFGIKGVLDRFTQIEPKVLFAANGYFYNGKAFDSLEKLNSILDQLPSVKQVVVTPYTESHPDISSVNIGILWNNFLHDNPEKLEFEQLPFDHPIYIMYSSGTTGLPKSIVHGAGGTLLKHLSEHRYHSDVHPGDRLFYYTTCGWMMWNWLVSGLASAATLILYDGAPIFPGMGRLWRLIEDERITHFGASPKFLGTVQKSGYVPRGQRDLSSLRSLMSTGSTLPEELFEWVYQDVADQMPLMSISGGTDLVGCFMAGNPNLPVYSGEIQCKGIGMGTEAFTPEGQPTVGEKGELVCTTPFPSMPVFFWNDEDGAKYRKAYFERFPNVWTHGDFIEITERGGVIVHGRSDTVLNPGGVRIGTAEIYRPVEAMAEVVDSLVVGQPWEDDVRVVLFVVLREGTALEADLEQRICQQIRTYATPRHVPARILTIPDVPRTISGKKVEKAVLQVLQGEVVENTAALANPESLDTFRQLRDDLRNV